MPERSFNYTALVAPHDADSSAVWSWRGSGAALAGRLVFGRLLRQEAFQRVELGGGELLHGAFDQRGILGAVWRESALHRREQKGTDTVLACTVVVWRDRGGRGVFLQIVCTCTDVLARDLSVILREQA